MTRVAGLVLCGVLTPFYRMQKHAQVTNRMLPDEMIDCALELLPKSLESVSPLADYYCAILNDDENDLEIVTDGYDWETFGSNFEQKSTWQPRDVKKLALGGDKASTHVEEKKDGLETALSIPKPYHKRRRTFSVFISTEDNNRADKCEFFGPYSHIRETLDYEYHAPYTRERQTLQDAVITDMLSSAVVRMRMEISARHQRSRGLSSLQEQWELARVIQ